ncbi:MAG TPA: kinase [Lysobacter sp.]
MSRSLHPPAPGFDAALVARVLEDARAHDARIQAIAGLQGSGKSTLAAQVAALARERGLRVAVLSVDDFYLGRRERLALARRVHPLLATRGPPGTHDVALACATLDALRAGEAVRLPRFDKLADTRLPPSRWTRVAQVDLVLFEGWFLKTPAQDEAALREPINRVERDEDPEGTWRRHCNDALARDYPALWSRLDRLLFLQPPGFEAVPGWRWQQETALREARAGRMPAHAMDRAQVERFVQLFERVSRQALRTLPAIAQWTIRLDAARRPVAPA